MNYTFVFIRYSSREEAMKVVELENNKRMDDLYVKVFMGGKPKREDNWRIEDLSLSDYHQVVVLIPKAVENDYNVHKSGDLNPRDKIEDIHVEPSWLSFLDDNPKGNNNLIDVPVRSILEFSKDSSGSSEHHVPTLDKEIDLFTIKPKSLKNERT
ncbi:hypothetical protein V6N11_067811 [Hibiscus sabdariffa]|uniref:RRM domain-containing protein n=1 Tax=Hibiscus sabdariffa TaxID=183260 RepID=A0ABR2SSI2_9ROSI